MGLLTRVVVSLGSLLLVALTSNAGVSTVQKLPIATLLTRGQLQSAFNYTMYVRYKTSSRTVKLQAMLRPADMDSSYSVIKEVCRALGEGIFALFSTHSVDSINALKSYAHNFQMPFMTPSMAYNDSRQLNGYEIYLKPNYIRAILDIVKHYEWNKATYMYDSEEALVRVQQLYGAISEDQYALNIALQHVQSASKVFEALTKLSSHGDAPKVILLDLNTETCAELFNSSKTVGAAMFDYHFVIVGLTILETDMQSYHHGGINVTGLSIIDYNDTYVKKFKEQWHQSGSNWPGAGTAMFAHETALTADAVSILHEALRFMVIYNSDIFTKNLKNGWVLNNGTVGISCTPPVVPWEHGPAIMRALRATSDRGLTGNVQFDEFGLRTNYKLDVWGIRARKPLSMIGDWRPNRGLRFISDYRPPLSVPTREPPRNNSTPYGDKVYRVTTIVTDPYLFERNTTDDGLPAVGNDRYFGYCVDLLEAISKEEPLLSNYVIVPVQDGEYGSRRDDGTWSGMIGDLVDKKADLSVAPLTITSEREDAIDFSKPFMELGISIMIKKPPDDSPSFFSFLSPLSTEIWMCVIFAYVGVSVVLFLVSRFSPLEFHVEDGLEGPVVTNNITIFNSLWFCLGAFMQQGCDIEPRSTPGRIAGSVWWFFTLIVISSYTANLAAFLTVQRMNSPIQSAEDLAKQTEIKYGSVNSGSTKEFFKTSSIPLYEKMYAFMDNADPSVFVEKLEHGVKKVRDSNGKYAFLIESVTNDYENQRIPCDTMKVGENLDSKGYGIGTPRGSHLRDPLTVAILKLIEDGELKKIEDKWWYEEGQCGPKKPTSLKGATNALKLTDVGGIFFLLIGGMVSALLIATVEFLYKSKVEALRRKTSFKSALRSKATLSIQGKPEEPKPAEMVAPAQLISLEGFSTTDSSTQV